MPQSPKKSSSSSNRKVANSLVALSSAAVLAVYSAGYVRTRAAAERYAQQSDNRRSRPATKPAAVLDASLNVQPAPVPLEPAPAPDAQKDPQKTDIEPTPTPVPAEEAPPKPVSSLVPAVKAKPVPAAAAPKPASAPTAPAAATSSLTATAPAPTPASTPLVVPTAPVGVDPTVASTPMSPPPPWKDGAWKGWGSCRHGDLEATVIVENGKIKNARITDCRTRYSCSIIDELPPEVVERQTADVDRVGGATESADAYYYAVYEALRQANEAARGRPVTPSPAPQSN